MSYSHSLTLLQDMIEILDKELKDVAVRRRYAYDEIEDEIVGDFAEMAAVFPENAEPHWDLLVRELAHLNHQLAVRGAPLLRAPDLERFLQIAQARRGAKPDITDADMESANCFLAGLMVPNTDPYAMLNRLADRCIAVSRREATRTSRVPAAAPLSDQDAKMAET